MYTICTICIEQINIDDQIFELECNHIFHNNCIKKWFSVQKEKKTCPDCRKTEILDLELINSIQKEYQIINSPINIIIQENIQIQEITISQKIKNNYYIYLLIILICLLTFYIIYATNKT